MAKAVRQVEDTSAEQLVDAPVPEGDAAEQLLVLVQAEGRTVLQEDGSPWPLDGLEDPDTLFTRRRLADGDLIKAPIAPATSAEGDK